FEDQGVSNSGTFAGAVALFDIPPAMIRIRLIHAPEKRERRMTFLTAIPVYNEERHLEGVLREVWRYSPHILVVNDGSTDRTAGWLAHGAGNDHSTGRQEPQAPADLKVITHPHNRGYGAALISAFAYAIEQEIDVLVSMDCDGQHEPGRIPVLLEAIHDVD